MERLEKQRDRQAGAEIRETSEENDSRRFMETIQRMHSNNGRE